MEGQSSTFSDFSYLDKWRMAIARADMADRLRGSSGRLPTLLRCLDAHGVPLQSVRPGPQFSGLRVVVLPRGGV